MFDDVLHVVSESGGVKEGRYFVEDVYCFDNSLADIVFRLKCNDEPAYINRGLERGLSINILSSQILDSTVLIKMDRGRRIIEIRRDSGEAIYNPSSTK